MIGNINKEKINLFIFVHKCFLKAFLNKFVFNSENLYKQRSLVHQAVMNVIKMMVSVTLSFSRVLFPFNMYILVTYSLLSLRWFPRLQTFPQTLKEMV